MKTCNKCNLEKDLTEFVKNGKWYRGACRACLQIANTAKVVKWRQNTKEKLVAYFGSCCLDCGYTGPPFMFDFDHRDPTQKEFAISRTTRSWDKLLAEAKKCDLVCANCHRFRTHRQRCTGCKYCN